ncbi:acyltransferase [Vibrio sp. SS-MA-C1-2]|uniref:acyltransferase family protein n=1 Tax=Vibrio sp. SS-MA-C1-2 TaxID=2908646 RepID=UPI001F41B980|nr:acyltransferase family protein [Vibrio sp. SS-MA-C1-2]UJF17139.1 acyltransferase [Vibrio sp. SS-MA-C1-2]
MSNLTFRYDINGLRAIAVIAVVIFHFNANLIPGGFAGVDVFFVISGFLMTGIIFKSLESNTFSIFKFYVARANRIIPSLVVVCLAVLALGWFILPALEYKQLGKHVASSVLFLSNITYWQESGYFDASSHTKWLLHTWSLSAEWQFYIIYPVVLVCLSRVLSLSTVKKLLLLSTVLGFLACAYITLKWPNPAYFLLPTRAWEMMFGGLAFLYPLNNLGVNKKKSIEFIGFLAIIASYIFISDDIAWPGYLAFIPVFGTYLILIANRQDSVLTNNPLFQYIGKWSYSIYLWHWPIVVLGYYFDFPYWILTGLVLSVLLGFLNYHFIERLKFNSYSRVRDCYKVKPFIYSAVVLVLSFYITTQHGIPNRFSEQYNKLVNMAEASPYRDSCHISKYKDPSTSCEYFNDNVTWATLGDSHTVELVYALAKELDKKGEGIKHFSFSGCVPSYNQNNGFSQCSKWYNESVEYILKDTNIKNVLLNHRYTLDLFGDQLSDYPAIADQNLTNKTQVMVEALDSLILVLANSKENVYLFYPIPELPEDIHHTLHIGYRDSGDSIQELDGTSKAWYEERNRFMVDHFDNATYPENVHFIKPQDIFCQADKCFAMKDGIPLYFDDNHLSIYGAEALVNEMNIQ